VISIFEGCLANHDRAHNPACTIQKELESTDHRTPPRYVLRSLKKDIKANRIHGLTTVASPGFFGNASRDQPETNGRYGGKKTIRTP